MRASASSYFDEPKKSGFRKGAQLQGTLRKPFPEVFRPFSRAKLRENAENLSEKAKFLVAGQKPSGARLLSALCRATKTKTKFDNAHRGEFQTCAATVGHCPVCKHKETPAARALACVRYCTNLSRNLKSANFIHYSTLANIFCEVANRKLARGLVFDFRIGTRAGLQK